MLRFAPLVLLASLVFAPHAAAQSAHDLLGAALAQYEADMAAVDDYTLTHSVMGFETTVYAERVEGGAPLEFRYYTVLPTGLEETGEGESPMSSPYVMLDGIADHARYVGTEEVAGTEAHVIAVDDFNEVMREFDALPDQAEGELEIETLTLYLGAGDHRMHKMLMEGTMEREGQTSPVVVETHFSDYRTEDGLTVPFRTTMAIQGAEGQMDPAEREEARQQLEQARQQMESMPAAQRQMMERMMGDRLEQLQQMLEGENLTFEMEVTGVQVNAGRPD